MATRRQRSPADAESGAGEDFPVGAAMPAGELLPLDQIDDEPEQTATDRVLETLASVGADERAVVKVHRVEPNGKESWCDDYAPHDFEQGGMRMLREKWGPGVYSIRLYGTRNQRFGILTRAQVNITAQREAPASPIGNAGPLADVLRTIAEGQAIMLRALTERPAPADPQKQMAEMFLLMKSMREAMGESERPKQSNGIKDAIEAIQLMREASDLVNPPKETSDDSVFGMLKGALPMITEAIKANAQKGGGAMLPMPELPELPGDSLSIPAQQPAAMPQQPQTGGDDVGVLEMSGEALAAIKLRALVHQVITWARADTEAGDANVEKAANLLLEKLPDELIEVLELEEWLPLLCAQVPDAAAHPVWLGKVRTRLIEMLDEEDAGDTQTGVRELSP